MAKYGSTTKYGSSIEYEKDQTKSEYAKLSLIWFFNGGKNVKAKEGAQSIQEYQVYEKVK
ncbi:MAG: hypothetical protein LBM07_05660 [Culturomica sp.]|nr:hypothetical protein [Culturomica sp.]